MYTVCRGMVCMVNSFLEMVKFILWVCFKKKTPKNDWVDFTITSYSLLSWLSSGDHSPQCSSASFCLVAPDTWECFRCPRGSQSGHWAVHGAGWRWRWRWNSRGNRDGGPSLLLFVPWSSLNWGWGKELRLRQTFSCRENTSHISKRPVTYTCDRSGADYKVKEE